MLAVRQIHVTVVLLGYGLVSNTYLVVKILGDLVQKVRFWFFRPFMHVVTDWAPGCQSLGTL